ncbi:hypothetical protein [Nocardioides donggukensis]|nr:hypothetical protein [Nocardioides donggukensis]
MKQSMIRRLVAALLATGLSLGIATIGAAPAQADTSWGRVALP